VVRGAFHRFNARLAPSGAPRTLIKIARCVPHPCAQRESDSLPRPGSGRRVTLVMGRRAPFGVGHAPRQDASHRLLQPTCDPWTRKAFDSPSVGLSPPPTDPARGNPAFRRVTLTHGRRHPALALPPARSLAVAVQIAARVSKRPQVDARLTTPIELRVCCPRSLRIEEPSTAPGGAPVPRRFRPRVRLSDRHLCHPLSRRRCRTSPASSAPRAASLPPPRQRRARAFREPLPYGRGPRRPRVTSIDECTYEARSRGGPSVPATGLAVLPPRSSFRRFFARRCSRMIELDRIELDEGSLRRARNASRRPSTSAIETLHEHDRGRSEPRAPRWRSPAVVALFAGGCG